MGRTIAIAAGAAVGLIVLVLIGAPAVSGWYAADRLRADLKQLSAGVPGWAWEVERVERGLFSTEAVVRQRITGPATPHGVPRIGFPWDIHIRHGPTLGTASLAEAVATPRLPGQAQQVTRTLFQGEAPFRIRYRVGIGGGRRLAITSPSLDSGRRMPFTWKGLEASADIGNQARRVRYEAEMPGLRAALGANRIGLLGLTMEGDLRRARPYFWVGSSRTRLDSLRLQARNPETGARFGLDIAGLDMESESAVKKGLLRSSGAWRIASMFSNDTPYRKVRAEWRLRQVDAATLQRANELMWDLEPVPDPEAAEAQLQKRLGELPLQEFLAAEPELVLTELTVTTSEGKLDGRGRLRFKPASGEEAVDPARLPRFARGKLDLAMPETVFRRLVRNFARIHAERIIARTERFGDEDLDWMADTLANRRAHELRTAGLVDAAKGRITTQARWDGRRFTVNGQPVADLKAVLGSRPAFERAPH